MALTPTREIVFTEDDLDDIAAVLAELDAATTGSASGWVNFIPEVEEGHMPAPRNPVVAIFSARGDAVPLATWTAPAKPGGRANLGITHASGPKALEKLAREVRTAMQNPGVREKLAGLGVEPVADSPAEFKKFVAAELRAYAEQVRLARVTPE